MPGFSRQFFHTRFRGFERLVCLRKQGIVTVFLLRNVHDRGKQVPDTLGIRQHEPLAAQVSK